MATLEREELASEARAQASLFPQRPEGLTNQKAAA
jgi:hypothetical protein